MRILGRARSAERQEGIVVFETREDICSLYHVLLNRIQPIFFNQQVNQIDALIVSRDLSFNVRDYISQATCDIYRRSVRKLKYYGLKENATYEIHWSSDTWQAHRPTAEQGYHNRVCLS